MEWTVFVGNTASLSFLRFLQTTLKHHIGPSRFVDSQDSRRLFEAASPSDSTATFSDDLPDDAKQALLQCFLEVVSADPCRPRCDAWMADDLSVERDP